MAVLAAQAAHCQHAAADGVRALPRARRPRLYVHRRRGPCHVATGAPRCAPDVRGAPAGRRGRRPVLRASADGHRGGPQGRAHRRPHLEHGARAPRRAGSGPGCGIASSGVSVCSQNFRLALPSSARMLSATSLRSVACVTRMRWTMSRHLCNPPLARWWRPGRTVAPPYNQRATAAHSNARPMAGRRVSNEISAGTGEGEGSLKVLRDEVGGRSASRHVAATRATCTCVS